MQNKNKYIFVLGLYWSGSSALIDWFKSSEDISLVDGEFDIFRFPGKISQILNSERKNIKKKIALKLLKHTKTKYYIQLIINDENKKRISNLIKRLINFFFKDKFKLTKIHNKKYDETRNANLITIKYLEKYIEIINSNFDEIEYWRKWLNQLMEPYNCQNKFIVLDQPVFLTKHIEIWTKLFNIQHIFVVHRNPYDQYSEIVRQGVKHLKRGYKVDHYEEKSYYNQENCAVSFADMLLDKYTLIFNNLKYFNDQITFISFEDFILDHEKTTKHIIKKIGLKNKNLINSFNPSKSIKNIGIHHEEWMKDEFNNTAIKKYDNLIEYTNKYFQNLK